MSSFEPGHVCTVDGCERSAPRTSLCDLHRKRVSRHGEPGASERLVVHQPGRLCGIPGCGQRHSANGLCKKHWQRVWRRGVACPGIGALRLDKRVYGRS